MMSEHYTTFAKYNAWANHRLYDACQKLTNDDYMQDRKAFFGSIHHTLNHLLVVDKLWLSRAQKKEADFRALNQILHDDLNSLLEARIKQDHDLILWSNTLSNDALESVITYHTLAGEKCEMQMKWILSHLFNHQTHHRGQVHNMLSQAGINPPPLDLYYFLLK